MVRPRARFGLRSLLSPSILARRNAVYKGLLGGSRGWLAVGGAFWVGRFARRTFGRTEQTVALERLKPGQSVQISAITPLSRRQRRAARRARSA